MINENETPYTIIDWLRLTGYANTVSNAPYEIVEKDLQEIKADEYLRTKASILRVAIAVAEANGLDKVTRKREIVDQRSYLYYLIKRLIENNTDEKISLTAIGRLFNKDHATVLHGLRKVEDLKLDKEFNKTIQYLKDFFNNPIYVKL